MISTKPFFNLIEERQSLNIKTVVSHLQKTTNNAVLVEDDGYYASYVVPMGNKVTGRIRKVEVLLDFSRVHFGGVRYWLVCEDCHRRVSNLYESSVLLACRHCLNLDYGSRIYARNLVCARFIRYKKASELLATRRLTYAGKPTRSGRRLNRLVSHKELNSIVLAAFE